MQVPNSSGAAKLKEIAVVDRVTIDSKCRVDPKSAILQWKSESMRILRWTIMRLTDLTDGKV